MKTDNGTQQKSEAVAIRGVNVHRYWTEGKKAATA